MKKENYLIAIISMILGGLSIALLKMEWIAFFNDRSNGFQFLDKEIWVYLIILGISTILMFIASLGRKMQKIVLGIMGSIGFVALEVTLLQSYSQCTDFGMENMIKSGFKLSILVAALQIVIGFVNVISGFMSKNEIEETNKN